MKFQVIASGSKGNMTYIETAEAKILVDAGISYKRFIQNLSEEVVLDRIDAIFITHEHFDHISGVVSIINKTNATLFMHKESYDFLNQKIKDRIPLNRIKFLEDNKKYEINDFVVYTMMLNHYSMHCLGFVFESENQRLAYVTDTGFVPDVYLEVLRNVDALIIEANHDIEMLLESNRDQFLKSRILSEAGHISNLICKDILATVVNQRLKYIVLAHASEECNSDEVILSTIKDGLEEIYHERLIIAKQNESIKLIIIQE